MERLHLRRPRRRRLAPQEWGMPCALPLRWIPPLPLRAAVGLSAAVRVRLRVRLRLRALRGVRAEGVEGARLVRVRVRVTVGLGFG